MRQLASKRRRGAAVAVAVSGFLAPAFLLLQRFWQSGLTAGSVKE